MYFHVLTLFPEMVNDGLYTSVTGNALREGVIHLNTVNIRDYATNKHNRVDRPPYGGGAGMIMQPEPVWLAYEDLLHSIQSRKNVEIQNSSNEDNTVGRTDNKVFDSYSDGSFDQNDAEEADQIDAEETDQNDAEEPDQSDGRAAGLMEKPRVIYLTPQGTTFTQDMAKEYAREEDLIFLCGHYEGIDERVLEEIVTDYVSIGDYVLTGGELPAMVMIDVISRLVPGVLGNEESAENESFQDGLLEHPHYTRPYEYHGKTVPEVLITGHHANIERWRREQSLKRTYERRRDLLDEADLSPEDIRYLKNLGWSRPGE